MWIQPTIPDIAVIGIDPGTTHLGVAVMTIDGATNEFKGIYAHTYDAPKLIGYSKLHSSVYGDKSARLIALEESLLSEFMTVRPSLIGSESPFFYKTHPGAFGPLAQTMWCIESAVRRYDPLLPLIQVPPSNVKKAVNAKGGSDKDSVRNALSRYAAFGLSPETIAQYDEHSIDACAVCAYLYRFHVRKES